VHPHRILRAAQQRYPHPKLQGTRSCHRTLFHIRYFFSILLELVSSLINSLLDLMRRLIIMPTLNETLYSSVRGISYQQFLMWRFSFNSYCLFRTNIFFICNSCHSGTNTRTVYALPFSPDFSEFRSSPRSCSQKTQYEVRSFLDS
jgi:hypothetical protein